MDITGIYNYGIPIWILDMYRLSANVSRVGIIKRKKRESIEELSRSGYVRDSVTKGSVIDLLA